MPRLVAAILRHGHYHQPDNVPSALLPHPLTDKGRRQAQAAADELLAFSEKFDITPHEVIDTSRLLRAWQTGTIIARRLGERTGREFLVREYEDLAERSVGSAANLTLERIAEVIAADPRCEPLPEGWKADPDYRLPLPGAETLREAGVRAARHLEQTMNNLSRDATRETFKVFVGHGAAFRYAAVALGVLGNEEAPKLSMYHCRPVYLDWSEGWRHTNGDWKVRRAAAMD